MVQLPQQPDIFRRPDLPAFDGLPHQDCAFCGALRVARTLGTGGKDQNIQWVHGEFIVSSETIHPPHTQWVHGEFF